MNRLLVGNAPCSWGVLEFDEGRSGDSPIAYGQMLNELSETGYTGTELGDWGYMPNNPELLKGELSGRGLVMLGAFVPVALKYPSALHAGLQTALETSRLLAGVASVPTPYLVLADANGTEHDRTTLAGRIPATSGLSSAEWDGFAGRATEIAKAVFDETGLRTVFHHHCAGYVETPTEICTFLDLTDAAEIGLVFDTGHFSYGAGESGCDMIRFLNQIADRVWYIHCKDFQREVAMRARAMQWDYFTALRHGVFCELGKGAVDFPALLRWLRQRDYDGYLLVEQDVLPGMGSPKESARRNLDYLKSIEFNFTGKTGGEAA
jgi:inosose dehydratase